MPYITPKTNWKGADNSDESDVVGAEDLNRIEGNIEFLYFQQITGSVIWHANQDPPGGYLECDGSEISRETYSELFDVIGTTFGNGNGSTTFNIPDLRGEFLRGWDNERGIDEDRIFGSWQEGSYIRKRLQGYGIIDVGFPDETTDTGGTHDNKYDPYETEETRRIRYYLKPRNVALLPCIKY